MAKGGAGSRAGGGGGSRSGGGGGSRSSGSGGASRSSGGASKATGGGTKSAGGASKSSGGGKASGALGVKAAAVSKSSSEASGSHWTTGKGKTNKSHFMPYEILSIADQKRPGPNYSDAKAKQIANIMDSHYNTSDTTGKWNQKDNRVFERQIKEYATGEKRYADMTPGAKDRYHEQQVAYKDIRSDLKTAAPGVVPPLDDIYRHADPRK